MVLGPLLCVIPFCCIVANPQGNFSGLAQREGRLETWRESEGGIVCTVLKAFVYMVLGLFGSFFFEITFVVVSRFRPGNAYRDMLWFTILPFATFAPVLLLNVRFEILLPVGKIVDRVVVGTETGPPSYCGEEFFSVPSKEGAPFRLYTRYGGLRSTTGETLDYRGDKAKYDDPVFVAYNLFSLQADRVVYDVNNQTI
jgi:hypothetical protein